MTDRVFRVIMKQGTTNEVYAYEGRWITFAEAAASAYRERNKMGLSWKITQISEVISANQDPLRKLAKHLSDSPESQVLNVLQSLPSLDRAQVKEMISQNKKKGN